MTDDTEKKPEAEVCSSLLPRKVRRLCDKLRGTIAGGAVAIAAPALALIIAGLATRVVQSCSRRRTPPDLTDRCPCFAPRSGPICSGPDLFPCDKGI
jgi:hypothetical protein